MNFEDKIVDAIVAQWFDPRQVTDQFGNPRFQSTPAASVAAELLRVNEGKLVNAIVAKLDIDKIAKQVAANLHEKLTNTNQWALYENEKYQKMLQERVTAEVASRMADRIMAEPGGGSK